MITSNSPAWSQVFTQPATEFPLTPLSVISGTIPQQLQGTLYRNGPGRIERGQEKVGHWFDGDGAVLAVHFEAGSATGVYRYVQTAGYQSEAAANRYLYSNYGTTAPGFFWNNWLKKIKNSANTAVLPLEDRVLALWEGGLPYSLDLHSLETIGLDNLSDTLQYPFSAHPKIDPDTGDIYNFGVSAGKQTILHLYQCDRPGKVVQQNSINLPNYPIIHDFVLAGNYLVFLVSPVRLNLLPVIFGIKSFSDAMEWKPRLGTQILVCDRDTLSVVSKGETDPWYQWHYTNACIDQDGLIEIELVRYPDFKTNQYLKEVAQGNTKTQANGTLWQLKIDPKTAKVKENSQLLHRKCEFPVLNPHQVGKSWRYTYLATNGLEVDENKELFNAIARFDRETGDLTIADMGPNIYASEPIYVPQANNSETGWLLTVVYDGNNNSSEVRIYNSDRLNEPPLCRLALPSNIPPSFHGTYLNKDRF